VTNGRFVFDTNVLVSAFLFQHSTPQRALERADERGCLLVSPATLAELVDVFQRTKFEKYLPMDMRLWILNGFQEREHGIGADKDCRLPRPG
jgi:predicted nucleic acid-binding protein